MVREVNIVYIRSSHTDGLILYPLLLLPCQRCAFSHPVEFYLSIVPVVE